MDRSCSRVRATRSTAIDRAKRTLHPRGHRRAGVFRRWRTHTAGKTCRPRNSHIRPRAIGDTENPLRFQTSIDAALLRRSWRRSRGRGGTPSLVKPLTPAWIVCRCQQGAASPTAGASHSSVDAAGSCPCAGHTRRIAQVLPWTHLSRCWHRTAATIRQLDAALPAAALTCRNTPPASSIATARIEALVDLLSKAAARFG